MSVAWKEIKKVANSILQGPDGTINVPYLITIILTTLFVYISIVWIHRTPNFDIKDWGTASAEFIGAAGAVIQLGDAFVTASLRYFKRDKENNINNPEPQIPNDNCQDK